MHVIHMLIKKALKFIPFYFINNQNYNQNRKYSSSYAKTLNKTIVTYQSINGYPAINCFFICCSCKLLLVGWGAQRVMTDHVTKRPDGLQRNLNTYHTEDLGCGHVVLSWCDKRSLPYHKQIKHIWYIRFTVVVL